MKKVSEGSGLAHNIDFKISLISILCIFLVFTSCVGQVKDSSNNDDPKDPCTPLKEVLDQLYGTKVEDLRKVPKTVSVQLD